MKWLKSASAFAALCMIFSLTACTRQDAMTVGIDAQGVPLSFVDENGQPTGFEVELANEAAKRAGITVSYKAIDWNRRGKALKDKSVTSLWGIPGPHDQDKADMLFTKDFLTVRQIVLVLKDSDIKDFGGLANRSVGALSGSKAAESLNSADIAKTLNEGRVELFDDYETQFLALDSGQIDAIAIDQTMADYYIKEHALKYRVLPGVLSQEKFAVAFRRNDSDLRNRIQAALDEMIRDGTAERLSLKWFGENLIG